MKRVVVIMLACTACATQVATSPAVPVVDLSSTRVAEVDGQQLVCMTPEAARGVLDALEELPKLRDYAATLEEREAVHVDLEAEQAARIEALEDATSPPVWPIVAISGVSLSVGLLLGALLK